MKCAVCGKNIVRARLCLKHVQEYGTESDKYPPWLKYLIAQDQRDSRNEQKNFSLEYCDEIMDWYPEQRLRGVFKEIYEKQGRPTEEEALNKIDTFDPENQSPEIIVFSTDVPETFDENDNEYY